MRKLPYILLGLILATSMGAYAIQTGGFPYFPTFGGVIVKNFWNCNKPGHVAGEGCQIVTNGTGTASQNYVGIYDQVGTRFGYFGKAGTSDNTITYDSDGPLKLTGNNGTDSIIIDTSHNLTYNGATLGRTSFNNPKVSLGEYTANGSACSINSGVWQNQNLGACVRNSTGNYTVSFTTAYSGSPSSPICFAGQLSGTAGTAQVNTAGSTSVTVQVVGTTFVAVDGPFTVACYGF